MEAIPPSSSLSSSRCLTNLLFSGKEIPPEEMTPEERKAYEEAVTQQQ